MAFQKGICPSPGGGKKLSNRKLTAALTKAIEADDNKRLKEVIETLFDHISQKDDRAVSLKAITFLWERIEGRIPFAKETNEFAEGIGKGLAKELFDLRAEQAEQTDNQIAAMKESVSNGSGGGRVHAIPLEVVPDNV